MTSSPGSAVGLNFLIPQYAEIPRWFMSKITKLCQNLSKLCLDNTVDSFDGHGVQSKYSQKPKIT